MLRKCMYHFEGMLLSPEWEVGLWWSPANRWSTFVHLMYYDGWNFTINILGFYFSVHYMTKIDDEILLGTRETQDALREGGE